MVLLYVKFYARTYMYFQEIAHSNGDMNSHNELSSMSGRNQKLERNSESEISW